MGLLDNVTPQEYYDGNEFGNYQFTSLDNIINQFMVAYVGEGKILQNVIDSKISNPIKLLIISLVLPLILKEPKSANFTESIYSLFS